MFLKNFTLNKIINNAKFVYYKKMYNLYKHDMKYRGLKL